MSKTFTDKVREEIEKHLSKNYTANLSKASFDKVEIKKDLRYKFLNYGHINNPEKGYHAEYRFKDSKVANITLKELSIYEIEAKLSIYEERDTYILYLADASSIMSLLKLLGAAKCLNCYKKVFDKNVKVKNTMRIINAETANIKRTTDASLKQLDDIKHLLKIYKLESLDNDIKIVIKARKRYPLMSLTDLAYKIGISKSALNHRFIRIRKLLGD